MVAGLKVAAAGLRGTRGLKAGPVEEGSSGTVGRPGGGEGSEETVKRQSTQCRTLVARSMSECGNQCVCVVGGKGRGH